MRFDITKAFSVVRSALFILSIVLKHCLHTSLLEVIQSWLNSPCKFRIVNIFSSVSFSFLLNNFFSVVSRPSWCYFCLYKSKPTKNTCICFVIDTSWCLRLFCLIHFSRELVDLHHFHWAQTLLFYYRRVLTMRLRRLPIPSEMICTPELSILNFPVLGSGDLIRQLKGHESLGYDFNQTDLRL